MAAFVLKVWVLIRDFFNVVRKAQFVSLKSENIQLKDQINCLNEKIAEYEKEAKLVRELKFHDNAYWYGEEGPFCSTCWDKDKALIRLHTKDNMTGYCNACNATAIIDVMRNEQYEEEQMNKLRNMNNDIREYLRW